MTPSGNAIPSYSYREGNVRRDKQDFRLMKAGQEWIREYFKKEETLVGKVLDFKPRAEIRHNIGPKPGKSALPSAARMFKRMLNKYGLERRDFYDDLIALREAIRRDLELLKAFPKKEEEKKEQSLG